MMHIAPQFSVFMVNKPGVLAQALGEFAKAKINITAITMMDSAEHGVMRVVFEKPEKAREVLSKLSMPHNETEVLCVDMANKSGALATVADSFPTEGKDYTNNGATFRVTDDMIEFYAERARFGVEWAAS